LRRATVLRVDALLDPNAEARREDAEDAERKRIWSSGASSPGKLTIRRTKVLFSASSASSLRASAFLR